MKIAILTYDAETGEQTGRIETTLARYVAENPNLPAQYVIRDEIRNLGAFITVHGLVGMKIRTEVVKL